MIKDVIKKSEEKMNKTINSLNSELATMKAGRANPTMLDRIQVEYYGSMCPLNQVANVSSPEPRLLVITPWEKPMLREIEKAILKSDLGINPNNDGTIIRLLVPELTEETRKNLVKNVKKVGEQAKVAIRSIRKDANDKVKNFKKEGTITEDEMKKGEDDIQKVTDKFVKEIDTIVAAKEKRLCQFNLKNLLFSRFLFYN
ncbi:ribosome recycling factor [Clostridium perfringens]|nr:ribosome recycling factor [Clostridium perfringens]